jgi:hypothetical protein
VLKLLQQKEEEFGAEVLKILQQKEEFGAGAVEHFTTGRRN